MNISDVRKVKINWMEHYGNDPSLTVFLKPGRERIRLRDMKFRQFGRLFVGERDNEVIHVTHSKNNHEGFGGSWYELPMTDDYDPIAAKWRDCPYRYVSRGVFDWRPCCRYEGETRTMFLRGPWSGSSVSAGNAIGKPIIDVACQAVLPHYGGHVCLTVEFCRELVDKFAPHAEMWEGDFGWTVKWRDMPPKNPRRFASPVAGDGLTSGEQNAAIYA
jgi:hypothetical protein